MVFADSHPPLADLSVDERPLGEAPLWIWLRDGAYRLGCKLPEQRFKSVSFTVPRASSVLCQREETMAVSDVRTDEKMSGEEKAGSVLVWMSGMAGTLAAIILPILFLL